MLRLRSLLLGMLGFRFEQALFRCLLACFQQLNLQLLFY